MSYVTGAHAFKVGFHQQYLKDRSTYHDTNPHHNYFFFNGFPILLYQRATPYATEGKVPWDLGIYAQDRWTIDRLTLDLGVRYALYTNNFPDTPIGPGPLVPTRNFTFPGAEFYNMKDFVPRLGASYDLFGDGRTAVKVALNKYLDSPAPLTGSPYSTLVTSASRSWNDFTFPGDSRSGNYVADCDLTSVAANGECGPLSDANFGTARASTAYDPAVHTGWGARESNWEFLTSIEHELVSQVSLNVGYFRRTYGNLLVTDNRALAPSDYDPYCITAPVNPGLPQGGGSEICGLYDLNPGNTIGGVPVDNLQTFANTYGTQYEHWNGVDVGLQARLPQAFLSGGLSSGRTSTDDCDVVRQLDNPSELYCHVDTNFLTQLKAYGSYTIPRVDVEIAGTFQSIPGPQISANVTYTSAQIAESLGRPLSTALTVTQNVVEPGTLYGERLNQLDLRFGKRFDFGGAQFAAYLDIYNVLNVDTVLLESGSYNVWRRPLTIIGARFAKVTARLEF